MGFLLSWAAKLFAGRTIIPAATAVGNLITKYHEDNQSAEELKECLAANSDEVEAEIAKVQAASSNKWENGARPFILWVCGTALFFYLVPRNVMTAWVWSYEVIAGWKLIPYPDNPELIHLVIVVLGLGGMHMVENLFGRSK